MPQPPHHRYGIAEWFGQDITTLPPTVRKTYAQLAMLQTKTGDLSDAPICPFLSSLNAHARCNKASGVCTLRRFSQQDAGIGTPVPGDQVVTVCPSRFLERTVEGIHRFAWLSQVMLDIQNPTVIKETPFLHQISNEEGSSKASRIDWILLDPNTVRANDPAWCAVETQSLYFSGDKMQQEFEAYAATPTAVLFPAGRRRPDYRSSGPKRLAPQLDVKVPGLRNWGKKMAILVDRYFFENMNRLDDAYSHARNDRERRDNSDVIWFVVDYDDQLHMREYAVLFTTLESSRHALNATAPLSKGDFTQSLQQLIQDESHPNKVFRVSTPTTLE